MHSELSKRKKQSSAPMPAVRNERDVLQRQMLSHVGLGAVPSIDPVYRLSNELVQNFDAVGKRRNAERHGGDGESVSGREEQAREGMSGGGDTAEGTAERASREALTVEELRRRHDSPVFSHSEDQLRRGDCVDRFASHAFHCGTLATSVMAGRGKEMFTTCFRRASICYRPGTQREKKLIASRTMEANVAGQPARVLFGHEAHTAVGITVDCIRSVVRTLDIFKQLANDTEAHSQNRLGQHGVETLLEQYPFLQTDRDDALIAQYRSQLKALEGDNSPEARMRRQALDSALTKAAAIRSRKAAQERRFLTKLAQIDANVREAERMFSADGFAESILEELDREPDLPPEDGDGKRRTVEDSLLGEILEALFGDGETEAADGEDTRTENDDGQPSTDTQDRADGTRGDADRGA